MTDSPGGDAVDSTASESQPEMQAATQVDADPRPETEIERLRAERDLLAAQVEKLEHKRQSRIRSFAVSALVVVLCITFLASIVGVYAKRNTLNNEVFSDKVAPLGADPAVQAALGVWVTDQVMVTIDPKTILQDALPERAQILATPLANAIRGFVGDQVDDFLASDRFADLWATATTRAHATAVKILEGDSEVIRAQDDTIVVNLIPVINAALADIGAQSPEIFGRAIDLPTLTVDDIPEVAKDKLSEALGMPLADDFGIIRINSGGGALSAAQTAVQWFTVGVWALVLLTILLIPLTLWLSHRRRRTLLQMAAGLLLVTVLLRRVVMTLEGEALARITNEINNAAASSVLDAFIDPLLSFTLVVLWVLAAIGVVALITGPYAWATSLRELVARTGSRAATTAGSLSDRATSDESIAWIQTNVTALQVAGGVVGFILLMWLDLTWGSLFLLALLIGGYELGLWWLAERDEPADGAGPGALPDPPDVVGAGTPF